MTYRPLELARVDTPCPKQWDELVGDDARRYCGECQLSVTNLSALTRREGERFLVDARERQRSGERVCTTFARDANGAIVSAPTRAQRLVAHLRVAASWLVGLLPVVTLGALGACRPEEAVRVLGDLKGPDDCVPQDPAVDPATDPGGCDTPDATPGDLVELGGLAYVMGEMVMDVQGDETIPVDAPVAPHDRGPSQD